MSKYNFFKLRCSSSAALARRPWVEAAEFQVLALLQPDALHCTNVALSTEIHSWVQIHRVTNTQKYKHKYIKIKAPQHDFASTALLLGVVHWHHLIAKMQGNTGDYKYTFKQRRIQIHQGQRPSEYKFMIAIDRWILFGKMRARWSLTWICLVPLHKIKWSGELRTNRSMLQTDHTKFCTNEPFAELRTIRRPAICMNGFLHRLQSPVFCICVRVLRQSCQVAGLQSGAAYSWLAALWGNWQTGGWITWNARDLYDRPSPETFAFLYFFSFSFLLCTLVFLSDSDRQDTEFSLSMQVAKKALFFSH